MLPCTSSHYCYTIPKHWQTHRTHQPNTLTDGLASHLLMCCVVVSSPSTPVNMGRCCRVASHLLCLCCPTPALPVRHTAACGCVIDCHVASHGCASSDSHVVYRCKLHDTKTLADAQNPHSHSVVVVLQFVASHHITRYQNTAARVPRTCLACVCDIASVYT